MLEISDLSVRYGAVRALDGVSLSVPERSITAVLGANGAGKTTLLSAISGVVRPASGSAKLEGRDLIGLAPEEVVRLGIAQVPEGGGVIQELTVDENLRLGGLWRKDRADQRAARDEMYELFPRLEERSSYDAAALSGGERRMLSIARALMARPRVLLLDEPSLGLAPALVSQLMGTIARLRERTGLTVLLIEQNVRSALSVADDAALLSLGKLVTTQPAKELAGNERLRHMYLGF
ncbi:MAG: ABC transporter ATP-binding protein [Thermoleophilaceae bacterium]